VFHVVDGMTLTADESSRPVSVRCVVVPWSLWRTTEVVCWRIVPRRGQRERLCAELLLWFHL